MSKSSHFFVGIGLILLSVIIGFIGFVAFIGTAVANDSVPGANVFKGDFMILYVVFGGLILFVLWAACVSFRRSLRVARKELRSASTPSVLIQESKAVELSTPNQKLAHLVKSPKATTDSHCDH